MAGRGTDIKLGGNKDFIEEGKLVDKKQITKDEMKVKDFGGGLLLVQKDTKVEG